MPLNLHFAPRRGRNLGDLAVGQVGQTRENIPEISIRIDPATAAAFNDRVKDRCPFSGVGFADEQ